MKSGVSNWTNCWRDFVSMEQLKQIRRKILTTAYEAQEGHIASSLSIVEILYVLYGKILTEDDYFILSKGHASLGLYAVLDYFGYLNGSGGLETFCKDKTCLPGHPDRVKLPYIEASTGSLGHGLPIGVGIAMGLKAKGKKGRVFVLIGDGEANEGSVFEAANLAAYHNLGNLCCIIDQNGSADRALTAYLPRVFNAFGWSCDEISGHNLYDIENSLSFSSLKLGYPLCISAVTVKGCGVSFMENNPEWHHKNMNEEEYSQAMKELE